MTKVLVVDDEQNLVELVENYLLREGFEVYTSGDGLTALEVARAESPDLVVLDLMLPGLDGLEVCRRLRLFSEAYVIMLTAKTEEIDKIIGLSVGADDYLTKPFSPRELVARVKAMLRRPRTTGGVDQSQPETRPPRQYGDLLIDELRYEITRQGEKIPLTSREFALLLAFAAHPGQVFTRSQLLEKVWGDDYYDDHVVDVHIANLRKELEAEPSRFHYIETIRGVGYRFEVQEER